MNYVSYVDVITLENKNPFIGSDRSSINADLCSSVRPSVRPVQVCLEQSIFIFLGQRAVRKQSENTHTESYSRSLKYCVLLMFHILTIFDTNDLFKLTKDLAPAVADVTGFNNCQPYHKVKRGSSHG